MNEDLNLWMQLLFRWLHVLAGVIWIGHLYFFNWVNANFAKTMEGPTKKAVIPQLMPRALYFFRWGAAWTFITGFLLAGLVYYMPKILFEDPNKPNWPMAVAVFVGALVAIYLYDVIMKMVKNLIVANLIVLALFTAVYFAMVHVGHFSGRALYIHAGAIFGTVMAFNVWMRIWPAQKKIITAIRDGNAPDADLVALAGQRSRHNTFMSVPLLFLMVSNHYPNVYGHDMRDLLLALIIALGFLVTWLIFQKAAKVQGF